MRLWLPPLVLLACVPTAAAAWVHVPSKRSCGPLPAAYVCSATTQVSFGYPVEWRAAAHNDGGLYARSLIRFGTQAFDEPLRPGGVAGGWYVGGAWTLDSVPGRPTTVGGMAAKIYVEPEGCAYLNGDELIGAWVQTRRRHARYFLLACIREPQLDVREAEIARLLASARFPYG